MKVIEEEYCTGCSLCQNICPKEAISMHFNAEGFITPVIDGEKCIHCGLCEKYCIAKSANVFDDPTSHYYKGHSFSNEIIKGSSSGGVFPELARVILDSGGIVYGAIYEDFYTVKHVSGESLKEIELMKHSKYIQSDASNIYKQVLLNVKKGRTVLFVGTPCQIYALKVFVKADYPNLYLVDLLCFGVMSSTVFKSYVEYILNKNGIAFNDISVSFRKKGVKDYPNAFTVEKDGKILYSERFHGSTEGIGYLFGSRLAVRQSCENCAFQSDKRCGDITIGDYVQNEITHNNFNTSLIIANNGKGEKLLKACHLIITKLSSDEFVFSKKRLNRKPNSNPQRKRFLNLFINKGFDDRLYSMCVLRPVSFANRIWNKLIKIYKR